MKSHLLMEEGLVCNTLCCSFGMGKRPGMSSIAFLDNSYIGREQAERLAEAVSVLPLSAIISSPLERAVETAEYLALYGSWPEATSARDWLESHPGMAEATHT